MSVKYLQSKLDNKKYCVTNGQFQRHLNIRKITALDYFESYISKVTPLCEFCLNRLSSVRHSIDDFEYYISCGTRKCKGKAISNTKLKFSDKKKQSINRKIKTTKDKWTAEQRSTASANHKAALSAPNENGISPMDVTIAKRKLTKKERYGDEYWSNPMQMIETKKKWSPSKRKDINDKRIATCLSLYGVENILLNKDVQYKLFASAVHYKNYTTPSGNVLKIQGYEYVGLNILYAIYSEDDIITQRIDMPVIFYEYEGKSKRYYPDIYIKSQNKIIEIKSTYTFEVQLSKNTAKGKSVREMGFLYEVWICDKKNILEII